MAVALLTGGASGFGAEVARQLARRGDSVVLVDVDEAGGQRVAEEVGGTFLRGDVSSYDDVVATTRAAEEAHGRLDLVFLNAGIATGCGLADDFELATYRRAMGVNLDGVVFGVHAAIPALRRAGGGSIVATASMAGLTGTPFDPVYGANKHAVVGLVRALGPALAPEGIRVHAFCPGFAETGIITDIKAALVQTGVPIIPVDVAGRAVLQMFDSPDTGQAWLLQAGREPMVYGFRGIPGPLRADGSPAQVADPTALPAPGH
ncbi:MAG TPA: SDR family NAD(P)-dependent oxidoreductase [Mycobacteriales bacterium]|nr:SDR family NAD(P)-dependent oxidoreductase [Mycobacteriales bacterium]